MGLRKEKVTMALSLLVLAPEAKKETQTYGDHAFRMRLEYGKPSATHTLQRRGTPCRNDHCQSLPKPGRHGARDGNVTPRHHGAGQGAHTDG